MPSKKHRPEEIIGKLREAEIVLAQGGSAAEASRRIAVSEQTYYRWRKEYGGLKTDQARRMKDLEKENGRLRRAISETPRCVPAVVDDAVFDLWDDARANIFESWMAETDPANLQPKVRLLNQRVAEFIRANRPVEIEGRNVNEALDILEAPWPRREETLLRELHNADHPNDLENSRRLVEFIRETGLEPFTQPPLLLPVEMSDVRLVCWMAIEQVA